MMLGEFFLFCLLEMDLGQKYFQEAPRAKKIDDGVCRSIFFADWWTKIRFADDNPTNSVRLKWLSARIPKKWYILSLLALDLVRVVTWLTTGGEFTEILKMWCSSIILVARNTVLRWCCDAEKWRGKCPKDPRFQHENHPENTPSPAKVGNLQVDELVWLSRSADHADLTRERKLHTRRLLTHWIGPLHPLKDRPWH